MGTKNLHMSPVTVTPGERNTQRFHSMYLWMSREFSLYKRKNPNLPDLQFSPSLTYLAKASLDDTDDLLIKYRFLKELVHHLDDHILIDIMPIDQKVATLRKQAKMLKERFGLSSKFLSDAVSTINEKLLTSWKDYLNLRIAIYWVACMEIKKHRKEMASLALKQL